ncbi:MAG: AAA family ATPase, partial [Candidatus Omnitrophica bacterium]|nr:AAA family ATPase [Candidatus Omnitrophota bacterium]
MARIIVILSTKGGTGKTLIAANMAVSLAKDEAKKVCLIDLDLSNVGDMARMLDLTPQKAMVDIINLMHLEPEALTTEGFLTHNSHGIDFLPGVLRPQQSPHLEPERIKDVFNLLHKDYDYIIVDAGRIFTEVFVAALNQASLILLVVTPDILSVYQTKWVLDTLQFLHFPLSMVRVVLNRSESAASISWQEIRVSLPV